MMLLLLGACASREHCEDVEPGDGQGVLAASARAAEGSPTWSSDPGIVVYSSESGTIDKTTPRDDGWACVVVPAGETLWVGATLSPNSESCSDSEYTRVPEGGYVELTVEVYCPDADTADE